MVAVVGLLLVTVHGMRLGGADALRAAILYAVYGAGCLALTARWRRLGLSYLGLALTASAALWALWRHEHYVGPLWGEVLAIEALVMAAAAAVIGRVVGPHGRAWYDPWYLIDEAGTVVFPPRNQSLSLADIYRIPLAHAGEAAAMLAAGLTVWTAWHDWKLIIEEPTPASIVAAAAIAAVYFVLAWLYRSSQRTWIASTVAMAGTIHALNYNYIQCVGYIGPNWTIALLGHATAVLAAAWCLDRLRNAREAARQVIGNPLADAALASSALAVPVLVFGRSTGCIWLACCLPWLAALWLVLAHRKRSVALFAAHQAALTFAALAAATVWLKRAEWVTPAPLAMQWPNLLERIASYSDVILQPRVLEVYGIALGLLSLAWVVVRIVDLRRARDERRLLQSPLSVDWLVRQGVVAGLWLVLALCALGELPHELARSAAPITSLAFGSTAWIALGVLALMLAATLWERWGTAELVSSLLAAAALGCLVAGQFATDLAVASALRWALAVGFLLGSLAVWQRGRLYAWMARMGDLLRGQSCRFAG